MLKRLATASVLTLAVGGVLMNATPAMAGDHHKHHKHHKHYAKGKHYHHYDNDKKFHLDFTSHDKDIDVDNETLALLNCVNILGGIAGSVDQNCLIGNTDAD
ncbi:hypothetical protein [Thermomonospora catenispora]|uniref:hypothetical protein n=1 Tax=Thermomonospora catenispora TaxID=2493090 RepID=UPI00111CF63F|nr:hypothetical protein [Thermomonospora catenispora]TNY37937.1 hypothetical protein EIO00_04985 [Thermomonospora catenispora]